MAVLVYAESSESKLKKVALEATSYARKVADKLKTDLIALAINTKDVSTLYDYGANKVLQVNDKALDKFNAKVYSNIISQIAEKEKASVVIIDSSSNGIHLSPMVSVLLDAGLATNVVEVPSSLSPFIVKRKAFSNKAFNNCEIKSRVKVIGLAKNAYGVHKNQVKGKIEDFTPSIVDSKVNSVSIDKTKGKISISDADIVVSGGRGLKGPENWGMIEELADVLNAATACSKPVSDLDWRPHAEHVGQTGKQVACNLYIAIGISGAIQHLAGINASKVKVVINTDPEAPFFKAADYGIVGDAFEVVPKLTEKLKKFKNNNA